MCISVWWLAVISIGCFSYGFWTGKFQERWYWTRDFRKLRMNSKILKDIEKDLKEKDLD